MSVGLGLLLQPVSVNYSSGNSLLAPTASRRAKIWSAGVGVTSCSGVAFWWINGEKEGSFKWITSPSPVGARPRPWIQCRRLCYANRSMRTRASWVGAVAFLSHFLLEDTGTAPWRRDGTGILTRDHQFTPPRRLIEPA